jgi:hypothetical protein
VVTSTETKVFALVTAPPVTKNSVDGAVAEVRVRSLHGPSTKSMSNVPAAFRVWTNRVSVAFATFA